MKLPVNSKNFCLKVALYRRLAIGQFMNGRQFTKKDPMFSLEKLKEMFVFETYGAKNLTS